MPHGLVRHGVAPDHLKIKDAVDAFARVAATSAPAVCLGLDVGRGLALDDVLATHHAVVYATGTPQGRRLGLPGEGLPTHAARRDDLDREWAVISGNVTFDMARVLLLGEDRLHASEVWPRAPCEP